MARQTRIRLFSLLVLLGVLAGILVTPASQTAYAAPCCTDCDARFNACLSGILYTYCGGVYWCCAQATDACYRYCSFSC